MFISPENMIKYAITVVYKDKKIIFIRRYQNKLKSVVKNSEIENCSTFNSRVHNANLTCTEYVN